jgi:hypothetical protein
MWGKNISWVSMPCQLNRVDIVNCELWVCELVIFMNLLYYELVIFVNFLYYKFVILVNLLYHELWTCGICDALSILFYEVWYVYRPYFRFRPLSVYFPHRTFVSDVSEILISFPFPELPFSILFPIKNMKTVMVLVFTDHFHPSVDMMAVAPWSAACLPSKATGLHACRVHRACISVLMHPVSTPDLFSIPVYPVNTPACMHISGHVSIHNGIAGMRYFNHTCYTVWLRVQVVAKKIKHVFYLN